MLDSGQQAADDFLAECDAIYAVVSPLTEAELDAPTLFKNWSINDIIAHLHLWNMAADWTLHSPDKFQNLISFTMGRLGEGMGHVAMQNAYFDGLKGRTLIAAWQDYYEPMAARFAVADPDARVNWVGPDMSVKSCIIARQMEHWAHAQAIFDVLGKVRINTDRIKNVAHIGVTTYSWSFRVNGLDVPKPKPFVRLTAPSGAVWEWNEPQDDNALHGTATEFCQVVTQCRNIADTSLEMIGEAATAWMSFAQCFAGGAETPPAQGIRKKA
ncbi:TIGR03084 family metal-binding protein [Fretibacter rubidus]|uniref:TIGR03084 family metal-binding protein n=1 Tax=Fretibacter rubidus TaxID=570162 RepID=UPI00352A7F42